MAKGKRGQPTKYKPEYCEELIKFFDRAPFREIEVVTKSKGGYEKIEKKRVPNQLPFFSAFARKIGVHVDTLHEWKKKHKEFSEAYKKAKALQKEFLIQNGLVGLYNATAFIFTAKNLTDMRDKTEVEHHIDSLGQLLIQIQNAKRPWVKPENQSAFWRDHAKAIEGGTERQMVEIKQPVLDKERSR